MTKRSVTARVTSTTTKNKNASTSVSLGEMMASDLEHALYFELKRNGLKGFVCERSFSGLSGGRKWRFDVCFIKEMVAIEVMGGLYSNGKHSRERGFANDAEKSAEAQLMGWTVIAVTPGMLRDGDAKNGCTAIRLIKEALERSK